MKVIFSARILTGNELLCDDQLVDFKSWLLNLKSVTSSVIVTGALCDNSIYSGQEVTEAMFGITGIYKTNYREVKDR